MKLSDIFKLFKKKEKRDNNAKQNVYEEKPINPNAKPILRRNIVEAYPYELNSQNEESFRNSYIAFDVETTGFSREHDRIVEIGAVLFQNGQIQKTFSSLVNPGVPIPKAASDVNHITNEMLAEAPTEDEVYPLLIEFLGEALTDDIFMCAHNASFDIHFLVHTLYRLGYNAKIKYIDTLSLSKKYIHGLENYKQQTLEKYFNLENLSSHRAASDAENCGHIFWHLLEAAQEALETERKNIEDSKPNSDEMEVCAYIQSIIGNMGGNTKMIRFQKIGNGYVDVYCLNNLLRQFLRLKLAKKGNYIIVKSQNLKKYNYITEECSKREGETDNIRVCFSSPFELEGLSEYIYKEYSDCKNKLDELESYRERDKNDLERQLRYMSALSDDEVTSLLEHAVEHDRERAEAKRTAEEEKRKKEEIKKQKEEAKAQREAKKEAAESEPKKPRGRSVLQMDEDGNILNEYETISDAAREIGVDSKCITDAAKGKQKHAGGYRWKYKEE